MKTFVCMEFGPADGCRVRDIDIESPGKDQVMIEIRSASLNFPDALMIGFAAGDFPKIPFNHALLSERAIIGVFRGAWAARNGQAQRRNMETLAS